ncbi:MAG: M15 family metallopeptidase [Oscillospiraceae bacterium]|nr:M15 family metallopeptidase [Oscillospiraceae bacterium]
MTSNEIRKRAARRRRYFVLLLLVIIALIFAVTKIVSRAKESVPAMHQGEPNDSLVVIDDSRSTETAEASTDPGVTAAEGETYTPITETGEPGKQVSSHGSLYTVKPHIYVRINHQKKIPLSLAGGITPDEIRWTTNNANIVDVEAGGYVTGLEKGECTVTASYKGEVLSIPVTVRELNVIDGCTFVDDILVANKSYSLPQSYDPGLLPVTEQAFEKLCDDAAAEGLDIHQGSGYRSYDFQVKVYNSMVSGYSKEYADTWSARPGYSEHQTGYTIDCNDIQNEGFADSPAGEWLAEHCHEYGFIIRYPEGKEDITGYNYESWHIRYVGIEHATAIYEQDLTLEEYLDIDSKYADDETDSENEE